MGRIKPLAYEELDDELKEQLRHLEKQSGYLPNSMRILGRKPRIALALMALNRAIGESITFSPELRRMMFHIMSHAAGCQYCQAHSITSLDRMIPADKLDALWEFEVSPLFSEAERAALRLAQASAIVPNAVTDAHFEDLRKFYSDDQIVEMVAALSMGAWLNRFNDTMATHLEEEPLTVAERTIAKKGWRAGKHGSADDKR